jgi:ABC-type nitrate/sulfonate/bicarbonate transport system permease component
VVPANTSITASVRHPTWTAILVVFLASLWPTVANTVFGVSPIRRAYLQVASLLQRSWFHRLVKVVLPAAAPAIVAGLRISFASANGHPQGRRPEERPRHRDLQQQVLAL